MQEMSAPVASQATKTARPVSTPPTTPAQSQNCDHCVKGGPPLKKEWLALFTVLLLALSTFLAVLWVNEKRQNAAQQTASPEVSAPAPQAYSTEVPPDKNMTEKIDLPKPDTKGTMSVEEALQTRRSRRAFSDEPVTLAEISQLAWAAQGITDEKGHRTAPSARSVYPYTIYIVVRNAKELEPGLYQYLPETHQLGNLGTANAGDLLSAAEVQEGAQKAPVVFMLSAAYGKMAKTNPADPKTSTLLEAGHIGQNLYLQIESLKMSGVVMAGFSSEKVVEQLKLHASETIVYLVPVGHTSTEPVAEE